jgi:hypothetical protein
MTGSCSNGNEMRIHTMLYYQAMERDKLNEQNVDRKKISKLMFKECRMWIGTKSFSYEYERIAGFCELWDGTSGYT